MIDDVQAGSDILREEIFGPVLAIIPFDDEDEAVRLANDTEYGLVGYVFTEDLARGQRMIERLETGMMGLNVGVVSNAAAPFGGCEACPASAARAAPRASTSTCNQVHADAEPEPSSPPTGADPRHRCPKCRRFPGFELGRIPQSRAGSRPTPGFRTQQHGQCGKGGGWPLSRSPMPTTRPAATRG